ncbi:MAG: hypothetical protein Q3998_03250 [Porphyromonas sp.]|nr:hypothetical protein [Porphyromonas sp.]
MTLDQLHSLLDAPEDIRAEHIEDLYALSAMYPYVAPLHMLLLKALYKSKDLRFTSELKKRSIYISRPDRLFFLLKGQEYGLTWYGKEPLLQDAKGRKSVGNRDETWEVITGLLQEVTTGEAVLNDKEELLPLHMIPEYDLSAPVEEFVEDNPSEPKTFENEETALPEEDELLTETLAKLYIRQGKYEQAKKIISSLRLKYPQKNSYFAEQIRFLNRLITNNRT